MHSVTLNEIKLKFNTSNFVSTARNELKSLRKQSLGFREPKFAYNKPDNFAKHVRQRLPVK